MSASARAAFERLPLTVLDEVERRLCAVADDPVGSGEPSCLPFPEGYLMSGFTARLFDNEMLRITFLYIPHSDGRIALYRLGFYEIDTTGGRVD